MAIRKSLIVIIIIGSMLALPDPASCRVAPSQLPQGITTFWINSAPDMIDEKKSEKHQTEVEDIGWQCEFVLWRMYCGFVSIPKVATSTHATAARTATAVEKTATKYLYNRNRGIMG